MLNSSPDLTLIRKDFEATITTLFRKCQDLLLQFIEKQTNASLSYAQQQITKMTLHSQEIKYSTEHFLNVQYALDTT